MPKPRQPVKVMQPLPELLLICLVGVVRRANNWVETEEYRKAKLGFCGAFCPSSREASHDTFSDVFNALDRMAFTSAFFACSIAAFFAGQAILAARFQHWHRLLRTIDPRVYGEGNPDETVTIARLYAESAV